MWRMCFKKQIDFHCYQVTSMGKIQNTTERVRERERERERELCVKSKMG